MHLGPLTRSRAIDRRTAGARARLSGLMTTPGTVVSALAWIGALLLVLSAIIHLHLWSQGYQHIPTIGPLFLIQGIVGIVLAITVAVSRHLVALVVGALFAIGTIGGLLLSVNVGLFGFRDSLSAPYATLSLIFEAGAFVVLVGAAVLTVARQRKSAHRRPAWPGVG
jgi:hypothetical protein